MKWIAAVALTLFPVVALASPEGSWPEEARGFSVPKPSWVLVVPAVRQDDGGIIVWDRTLSWSREWLVPKATPDGIKTIAITGDSEDKREVNSDAIDNMKSGAMNHFAAKYGAPAVAVVVQDKDGSTAVAVWKAGHAPTWDASELGRDGVLRTMDQMFNDGSNQDVAIPDEPLDTSKSDGDVHLLAQRQNDNGRMEYQIEIINPDAESLMSSVPELAVLERSDSVIIVRVDSDQSIEDILRNVGLRVQ